MAVILNLIKYFIAFVNEEVGTQYSRQLVGSNNKP